MTEAALSQWVVRLPDRLARLHRPLSTIRIFSTAEVLLFKTYYGSGESKSRIERQQDTNSRQAAVPFEYWVLLFPLDTTLQLEVLCCTVQRETADRILDSLWLSLFSNCGDNTYVDLRELLAADLVTPEQVAAVPAAGRFVDLGDGESRRPVVTAGSVATADIPVQTIPTTTPSDPTPDDDLRNWVRRVGIGGAHGRWGSAGSGGTVRPAAFDTADYAGIEVRAMAAAQLEDVLPAPVPVPVPVRLLEPEELMRHSTVPNIGRGMDRNDDVISPRERDRIQVQLQAALMRQQAENRNTHVAAIPRGVDYSNYLQPQNIAVPLVPPDNDAVDRDDPGF